MGIFSEENLTLVKSPLQKIIAEYEPQEWPCFYDEKYGETRCTVDCVTNSGATAACPEQELFNAERKLQQVKMRGLKRLAFNYPEIAEANRLLKGENIAYSSR